MMVLFKHKLFGTDMWVHESRVNEYKAAGYHPAAELKEKVIKDLSESKEPKAEAKAETAAKKPAVKNAKKPAAKKTAKK
jgi:hypothetical protein